MDNLVLIRVAAALDQALSGAVLRELRRESEHRYRLIFERTDRGASIVVSLRPELPWIGRPVGRWEGPVRRPDRLVAEAAALRGAVVTGLEKRRGDRVATLRFADGRALVAELGTHRANLILLDPGGDVLASARRTPSARERIEPGRPYRPGGLPARLADPTVMDAAELDAYLDRIVAEGESPLEALRRRIFGVGTEGAMLILEESRHSGRPPGIVLRSRLDALEQGALDPVVLARDEPAMLVREGTVGEDTLRLLPWKPESEAPGWPVVTRPDPALTAGLYHEAIERGALLRMRATGLRALLDREAERLREAGHRAERDLREFRDPDRFRRDGEALLAGLGRARRRSDRVYVPDPYDAAGPEIEIQVKPEVSLQKAAQACFERHRKAKRGIERVRERTERLAARRATLAGLLRDHSEGSGEQAVARLEEAMRSAGLPVALEPATRVGRAAARTTRPRLEGVRVFTSSDGLSILVGRSGKDNHRLTFRLAGPEDHWFHAHGVAGAHVVVRALDRRGKLPRNTLEEAASAAAWFSDAKREDYADVTWARRKHVRHPRGAPPGTVVVKKSETIRVRPGLPGGDLDDL